MEYRKCVFISKIKYVLGVDDGFLMIHTYMRIARRLADRPIADDTIAYRLGEMFVDIGPSIAIAAITNVLGFTVGIFTPIYEIQLFCISNAVAMAFEFVVIVVIYRLIIRVNLIFSFKSPYLHR